MKGVRSDGVSTILRVGVSHILWSCRKMEIVNIVIINSSIINIVFDEIENISLEANLVT